MSGGVDSSLAAKLTKDMGYECIGCMMKLHDSVSLDIDNTRSCCSLNDAEDERSIAFKLGMPFYVLNFIDDFKKTVINKFVNSYINGITPNPCIDCNRYMKFDKLFDRAKILGCDIIVTGHYARIEKENGHYLLKKRLIEQKIRAMFYIHLRRSSLRVHYFRSEI